jgi:hypothetical protein
MMQMLTKFNVEFAGAVIMIPQILLLLPVNAEVQ